MRYQLVIKTYDSGEATLLDAMSEGPPPMVGDTLKLHEVAETGQQKDVFTYHKVDRRTVEVSFFRRMNSSRTDVVTVWVSRL